MMTEEEQVTTYRVGIDIIQACGLEKCKGGGMTVLSAECFGSTERVQVRGNSYDAFFVFLVVVDRSRTKEHLTVRVLDLPVNTSPEEPHHSTIGPSIMNSSLVGQHQFDIEECYSATENDSFWCLLTRPDSDACTGWLKCRVKVTLENSILKPKGIRNKQIPSPYPLTLRYPEGYERAFDLVVHVDIWKAEGFAKQSSNKTFPVSLGVRVGNGEFSNTNPHRSSLNAGWCIRLSVCLQVPHPCDLLEMIVWSDAMGVSNAARRYLHLSDALQFPKWIDFYSVRNSNTSDRDSHAGKMLLSFEVEKIPLTPARMEVQQFCVPWGHILTFLPIVGLKKMMITSKKIQAVLMSKRDLRELVLHPRGTSRPLLPPPPSDSTSYSLRVDLYAACGLQFLIEKSLVGADAVQFVYVEVSWGGVRAWTTAMSADTATWCEQLMELSLELPVRHEDMPTVFLKVVLAPHKNIPPQTIGQLSLSPRELLENPPSPSIQWLRLSPHKPSFLQACCILSQTSQQTYPRPPIKRFNKIKYQARVHIWFAKGIVYQREKPLEVEIQCGKEVAVKKAKKGMRNPTWNATIPLSIWISEPQVVTGAKSTDWRARIAESVRGEAQRREAVGLETVGKLTITLRSGKTILGTTSITLNQSMVVRDGNTFGDITTSYSPHRPTWMPVGASCSLLASVDILHPDLSRFHPISAHPLRPPVGQKVVLSVVIANLRLYCTPCEFTERDPVKVILSVGRHQVCVEALSCKTFESYLTSPFVAVFPYARPEDVLFDPLFLIEIRSGKRSELLLGSYSAPVEELLRPNMKLSLSPPGVPAIFSDVSPSTRHVPSSNWKPSEAISRYTLLYCCRPGAHPVTDLPLEEPSSREAGSFCAAWSLRPYSS